MSPNAYLLLGVFLFMTGMLCALIRRNVFFILLGIELMLNAVNLTFVVFSRVWGDSGGQVYAFFIMALAAAEACVGLAIVVLFFRKKRSVDVEDAKEMRN